jgi:hypothetical protein
LYNPPSISGVASTINGNAGLNAAAAFNPLGTNHTVTFACENTFPAAGTGTLATGIAPGCYGVTASVQNSTTGDAATFISASCANNSVSITSSTVQCQNALNTTCPPTAFSGGNYFAASGSGTCTATVTTAADATLCTNVGGVLNTSALPAVCTFAASSAGGAAVTINSGAPDVYTVTFSGYVPAVFPAGGGAAVCPAGTSGPASAPIGNNGGPSIGLGGTLACQFFVSVQKKYVEITAVTTSPTSCPSEPIEFSEGLKAYFGPGCLISAAATGMTELKTGVSCTTLADGTTVEAGMTSSAAPAEFGSGALYNCVNGTLSVINIPSSTFAPTGLTFTFTSSGPGSFNTGTGVTLNNLCAGVSNTLTSTTSSATGSSVVLCPTGIGSGTVQACFLGNSTVNTQPQVCSANVSFTFTSTLAARVIPYVRWAGEKIVLTKCFGGAAFNSSGSTGTAAAGGTGNGLYAGSLVQFSLQADSSTGAILLPATVSPGTVQPNVTGPVGGAAAFTLAGSNTVYTVADQNGCASVIAYATNEGVVDVDAAIYSTTVSGTAGGVQLLNEHAFEVYYLKFDHLDLENITFSTYNTATALAPGLSFSAASPNTVPSGYPGASFRVLWRLRSSCRILRERVK